MAIRHEMYPKLSVNYILERITQEQIFAHYWNISPHEIMECVHRGKATYASYRDNNDTPALGFYEKNSKIYARDFAGYFWGDCFDAAAFTLNKGTSGIEFGKLLEQIAFDFGLHRFNKASGHVERLQFDSIKIKRGKLNISINVREWNKDDAKYWKGKYEFTSDFLDESYIYPVDAAFVNGLLRYTYSRSNPCYAYYFGLDNEGFQNWKLYSPLADKKKGQTKFMQNSSAIEGALLMKPAKIGIITKSYKDAVMLNYIGVLNSISLLAFAPSSESTVLNDHQMSIITPMFDELYTFTDFDYTGVVFANKMRKRYKTKPIFLTNGRFGTVDFKAKDITDAVEKYRLRNILNIANNLINNTNQYFQSWQKKELLEHLEIILPECSTKRKIP